MMSRIQFSAMIDTFYQILLKNAVPDLSAKLCARVIAQSTFDGVFTHGIQRFPGLIESLANGSINPNAELHQMSAFGAFESWDGNLGIGIVNATKCTDRAINLAVRNGIGCVSLRNNTHWLRAGSYGWQAVEKGYGLICWTNTIPNMPAWGALEPSVGNNPMVIAVPHPDHPIVLDIAMSQFSMGSLHAHRDSGQKLPVPGGFDKKGNLTTDAARIIDSNRALPMGFWKGSGMAFALDVLVVMLTGGHSSADYARMGGEHGVSQAFLAFDPSHFPAENSAEQEIDRIVDAFHMAAPEHGENPPRFPGEGALSRRAENIKLGIEVDDALWKSILALLSPHP